MGRESGITQRVNSNAIKPAVNCVDWNREFNGLNIYERINFLTECVLNISLPNKVITIRSKNTLWITSEIKRMIPEK